MSFPTTIYLSDDATKKTDSVKKWPLGTRGITSDGRVFRYALNGATALSVAHLVTRANVDNAEFSTGHYISTELGTITTTWNYLDLYCTWDESSTFQADKFADGYLVTAGSTGQGQMVRIKGNTTGVGATTSQVVTINFKEDSRLSASITTAQEIALFLNPYRGTLVNLGTTCGKSILLGVAPCAVAASKYYWLQTWGPCVMLGSAAVIGQPLSQDVTTESSNSGYYQVWAHQTTDGTSGDWPLILGVCWGAGSGTALEPQLVNLMLSP